MNTLSSPVYEVKQDSEWYQSTKKRREQGREFFKKVNEKYFDDNGFSYYHSEYFGIQGDSKDYEKYKDELLKHPNRDGVHPFKKRSKFYPIFRGMLEKIEEKNPFKSHDVLGTNNITGSQWVGDRWFFGVKFEKYVIGEEVEPIAYKDYLGIIVSALDKSDK